jgi:hypothetical protein
MNGFMRNALAAACVAGGLASTGCFGGGRLLNCKDPCYPERYNAAARQEVIAAFAPQVQNGHILDQTIWNYHFAAGTDQLTPGGMDKLDQLVRRRPEPDSRVFLATARDIAYAADDPNAYGEGRRELDSKRVIAIQKYLTAQTVGRPIAFEVLVHDPMDPAISAKAGARIISSHYGAYVGTSLGSGGGGAAVVGGGGVATGTTTGTPSSAPPPGGGTGGYPPR